MRDALEKVEGGTQNNPFDAVLVSFAKGLPNSLLFGCFPCYTDTSAASASVRVGWVFLDLSKFDSLGRDVVTSVCKVEHGPEASIGIWFGDLEEREVRRVGRGERKLVDG